MQGAGIDSSKLASISASINTGVMQKMQTQMAAMKHAMQDELQKWKTVVWDKFEDKLIEVVGLLHFFGGRVLWGQECWSEEGELWHSSYHERKLLATGM